MVDPHNTDPVTGRDPGVGGTHGHSSIRDVPERDKGGLGWLPWLLGALLLLGLLWFLTRDNDRDDVVTDPTTEEVIEDDTAAATGTVPATAAGAAAATTAVATPYSDTDLDTYLAGTEPLGRAYSLDSVNFAVNSAEITDRNSAAIASLAATLKKYPNAAVELTGTADPSGSAELNRKLSADRANAVKAALVAAGIADNRIAVEAAGETGATASRANRKVEMRVTAR